VRQVEAMKGEQWEAFVDRYKDWGRDLALYLGHTRCGLKLSELGELAGRINYATVSNRVRSFQIQLQEDTALKPLVRQIEHNLANRKV
jgi:chromosomal replication initiation ATPase DnaA